MLKVRLEKVKVNDEVVSQYYVAERIGFKMPVYLQDTDEARQEFMETCFMLSDYIRIKDAFKAWQKSDKDTDKEKLDAMLSKTSVPYDMAEDEDGSFELSMTFPKKVSRLAWAFCIGLNFVKPDRVPAGFGEVYNNTREYLNEYLDCNDWDEVRKQKYNSLRKSCEDMITTVILDDDRAKDSFTLKLSAKAFNLYLNSCKIMNNQTNKNKKRATVIKMRKAEECFMELMKAVNTCTGVTRDGDKGRSIKVF